MDYPLDGCQPNGNQIYDTDHFFPKQKENIARMYFRRESPPPPLPLPGQINGMPSIAQKRISRNSLPSMELSPRTGTSKSSMPSLKRRLAGDLRDFAEHTSAHGVPRAYVSSGVRRWLWLLLVFTGVGAFLYQAYQIVERYHRKDIIVSVEIKYKNIEFPSVTVCNLNPYKTSKALERGDVQQTLQSLQNAMAKMNPTARFRRTLIGGQEVPNPEDGQHRPRSARVYCTREGDSWTPQYTGEEKCICAADITKELYWNCAPTREWKQSACSLRENVSILTDSLNSTHPSTSLTLCHCNDDVCLETEDQIEIEGKWPLTLYTAPCVENKTDVCLCTVPQTSKDSASREPRISYCAPVQNWHLSQCNMCNWWGRCMRAFGLLGEEECICDGDSPDNCFITRRKEESDLREASLERRPEHAIRVRRHNKDIYEKILSNYEGLLAVYTSCECDRPENCKALKDKKDCKRLGLVNLGNMDQAHPVNNSRFIISLSDDDTEEESDSDASDISEEL